jgi:hypothetical protein
VLQNTSAVDEEPFFVEPHPEYDADDRPSDPVRFIVDGCQRIRRCCFESNHPDFFWLMRYQETDAFSRFWSAVERLVYRIPSAVSFTSPLGIPSFSPSSSTMSIPSTSTSSLQQVQQRIQGALDADHIAIPSRPIEEVERDIAAAMAETFIGAEEPAQSPARNLDPEKSVHLKQSVPNPVDTEAQQDATATMQRLHAENQMLKQTVSMLQRKLSSLEQVRRLPFHRFIIVNAKPNSSQFNANSGCARKFTFEKQHHPVSG